MDLHDIDMRILVVIHHFGDMHEIVQEILLASIQSKASDMPTCGFFDFVFKPSEVSKHFIILPHRINPGMPGEVVDEHDIILATTKCCHLGWSPHIWMYYIHDSFAHIPLFKEWLSMLFVKLQASHTPTISFSIKVGSPMTTPFNYILLSFGRLMWPICLCHNSMLVLAFRPLADIVDFIAWELRMNIER